MLGIRWCRSTALVGGSLWGAMQQHHGLAAPIKVCSVDKGCAGASGKGVLGMHWCAVGGSLWGATPLVLWGSCPCGAHSRHVWLEGRRFVVRYSPFK